MKLLFPCQPASATTVDPDFQAELQAAAAAGFDCLLFDHGLIERAAIERAFERLPIAEDAAVWHRSWMLTGEQYRGFYEGLWKKGYRPLVTPEAYEQSHYLPLAYPLIENITAPSVWNESDSLEAARSLYATVSSRAVLIKDWVKSAKYQWRDGCYIPAETSSERFDQIFGVFRAERGKLFNRGVMLREYLKFRTSGNDMRGFPRIEETRLFFAFGSMVVEPGSAEILRDKDQWQGIAARFQSPLISLDVAPLETGAYRIVEVGDGGVSGLPVTIDPLVFYTNLRKNIPVKSSGS
jgi:hypothetical protein